MPHSSLAIANEFLCRARDAEWPMTHMQLQKLIYIAHGWSLGSGHGALIDEQFEAWTFGPVVRKLYDSLRKYGANPIPRLIDWGDDTPLNGDGLSEPAHDQVDDFVRELLDWTLTAYGSHDAFKLSALTHERGTPWEQVYAKGKNRPIANDSIKQYFGKLLREEPDPA